ncbi:MAG: maltooligosyl trehalose synthase, partial [Micavibrio sp.]|nr:maltooligosyl trehalose synthase [Micavibrio sp.]
MTATYRLQLTKDFTLRNAAEVIDYLEKLNISHLYLSPVFESAEGSVHGYDGIDFSKVSEERGGYEGFQALCDTIRDRKSPLRLILDIVPNHMAAIPANPYWYDLLEKGQDSENWTFFDLRPGQDKKLHLPILGKKLNEALKEGAITIEAGPTPTLRYADQIFPLNAASRRAIAEGEEDVEKILDMQYYALVYWTESASSMTYRRFFDVTSLVGVRVEAQDNYNKMHKFLQTMLTECDLIDGVRVDHIDGLANPAGYLERLNQDKGAIWVEKIMGPGEALPPGWPVRGTTGYEFIGHLNNLLVNEDGNSMICDWWKDETHSPWSDFTSCVAESKGKVLDIFFGPELNRLISLSSDLAVADQSRIFWTGMTIYLPVYRTYITDAASEQDRRYLKEAASLATQALGPAFSEASEFFLPLVMQPSSQAMKQLVTEWQQLTGPVMAKGLEDTAHYRFTPLSALNEVGCDADLTPETPEVFYSWINDIGRAYPQNFKATSTHDSKRSEDARHRLYALSDRPGQWIDFCEAAFSLNTKYTENIGRDVEIFLYQAITGTWPMDDNVNDIYIDRIKGYALKSIREAKLRTSWLAPDEEYEKAVDRFISNILQDSDFITLAAEFSDKLAWMGALNSLAVLTLKILSPGLPDFYQGSELWNFSLVDPDNRRPVDFERGRELLGVINARKDHPALLQYLLSEWRNGAIKLWLTQTLLQIRRDFLSEDIQISPVPVQGPGRDRVLAYTLSGPQSAGEILVVCARPLLVEDTQDLNAAT